MRAGAVGYLSWWLYSCFSIRETGKKEVS